MDDISDRISFLVRNSGFGSLRALARDSGVSHTYLSLLMSDKRGRRGIGDDKAELLAKATGFNAEWIKTGEGPMRTEQAGDSPPQEKPKDPFLEEIESIPWADSTEGEDEPSPDDDRGTRFSIGFGSRLEEAMRHRQVTKKYVSLMSEMSVEKLDRYAKKDKFRTHEQPFHMVADSLGVSYEWLMEGEGSPNYDPAWRRLTKIEIDAHFSARIERLRRALAHSDAMGMIRKLIHSGRINDKEYAAAVARLELEWPKDINDTGSAGITSTDVCPNRYRAIVLLRPHLDDRLHEYLMSLKGPPYDQWDVQAWLAEAERLRGELAELDAKWGANKEKDRA